MISWSYALRRMRIFWFIASRRALLLEDLDDAAGTHGAATLTDREPQPLGHRDRGDQPHGHLGVIPRHRHLGPLRQAHLTGHVGGPEVKLRPVVVENGVCRPPSSRLSTYTCALNSVCGVILPGLASTWPRSTSSRLVPRSSTPMLSPACP